MSEKASASVGKDWTHECAMVPTAGHAQAAGGLDVTGAGEAGDHGRSCRQQAGEWTVAAAGAELERARPRAAVTTRAALDATRVG